MGGCCSHKQTFASAEQTEEKDIEEDDENELDLNEYTEDHHSSNGKHSHEKYARINIDSGVNVENNNHLLQLTAAINDVYGPDDQQLLGKTNLGLINDTSFLKYSEIDQNDDEKYAE